MIALRNEAVAFASFLKIVLLTEEERRQELYNAQCEKEEEENAVTDEVGLLQRYIQAKFERYTNAYVEAFFMDKFDLELTIVGHEPQLYVCHCCNYHTLTERGEYDICPVCYWEDDGTSDANTYSYPNRMSLTEGRVNFGRYGVMEERFVDNVDPERMSQYHAGG